MARTWRARAMQVQMARALTTCLFGARVFAPRYGHLSLDRNLKRYFFRVINFRRDWYLSSIRIKVECGCYSGRFYSNWDVEAGIWNPVSCHVDVNYVMGILTCRIFTGVRVAKDEGFRVYF